MSRCLTIGLAAAVVMATLATGAFAAEKIANLEQHLAADADYQKADLAGKLAIVSELGKSRAVTYDTATGMQIRVLQDEIARQGLEKDLPKLMAWLGGMEKDWSNPVRKAAGSALSETIGVYGTQRLYADPDFKQGDTIKKLLVISRLWKAKELQQSIAYALHNDLVYRYLQPAGDDIDKALELFGELLRRDAVLWECGGQIHQALMQRALRERPGLDTVEKQLACMRELVGANRINSLTPGALPSTLLILKASSDPAFIALDEAARRKKIDDWAADKLINRSNQTRLLGAFTSEP